jgi:hypothetical protein
MIERVSFKRLILRAVLRQVKPDGHRIEPKHESEKEDHPVAA